MKNILEVFSRRPDKSAIESEVHEELRFHIDMQTIDYERNGVSIDESRAMAETRFGDVEKIKKEL